MAASAGSEQPSMQELIRRRRRAGFVGRRSELDAFRDNFDVPPGDERHSFLFHIHGIGGVGKTSLVRELEQLSRERGALTAYVDEAVGSVPEAMAAISAQFALQGRRCKELNRLITAHRERRHEAESASLAAALDPQQEPGQAPPTPSTGSMTAARASLVGLGLLPGVGAFAGAVDPAQLAQSADRLRAGLSARLGSQDDVQLVMSPERVLTPVLLAELADAAKAAPWIVLFFDTYERTAPFLDGWLHEVMTTDRHGALPANVVVVTAGHLPFDTTRWGGYADFVTDLPLGPFTELEARGLLAGKGVVAEPVVEEVLRLSGGLAVLVSTLAEGRPAGPGDVGDPSATAVERFLKWERDPVRRSAALACALPRRFDADVFRAAVDGVCAEGEVPGLFGWLRGLPFVSDRGDRVQYHDVVRAPMLRLQRNRSPRGWAQAHTRLAETFAGWRTEAEAGLDPDELWEDEPWRELRLAESYHLLCAGTRSALPAVLRDVVDACDKGEVVARRWVQLLLDAGQDADAAAAGRWGRDLLDALTEGACIAALGLLADRAGLDDRGRAVARLLRGRDHRNNGAYEAAMAEYDRAVTLDPELARAYYGRGVTRARQGDFAAAITDLNRAVALAPNYVQALRRRGEFHRVLGQFAEALRDLSRAIEFDPANAFSWASRGAICYSLGQHDEALADLDRALDLDPEYIWALVRRARVWGVREKRVKQMADLDRVVELAPESAFVACERGEALRTAGSWAEALVDLDRAIELNGTYASAYASRGVTHAHLKRHDRALADLDRAVELSPDYAWALAQRSVVHTRLAARDEAFADADRAHTLSPDTGWFLTLRGNTLRHLGRLDEARADVDRGVDLEPDAWALVCRSILLRELRLYPEALTDLDRALRLDERSGALRQRVINSTATGRIEQSLADLARCVEIGYEPEWAHLRTAEIHHWFGRVHEAMAELTAVSAGGRAGPAFLEELSKAHRRAGSWPLARATARELREQDEVAGSFELAMAMSGDKGVAAAGPLWREAARLSEGENPRPQVYDFSDVLIAAGLEDWAALDSGLTHALAVPRAWDYLAELADLLAELLRAPGTDRARMAPRLAGVVAARDAVQVRYAEAVAAT